MKRNYIVYLTGTVLLMAVLLTGCGKKSGEDSLSASLEQSAADLMSLSGSKESETEGKTENSFPVIPSKSEEESSDEVLEAEQETLPYTVLETWDQELFSSTQECWFHTGKVFGLKDGKVEFEYMDMVPSSKENESASYELRGDGQLHTVCVLNDCEVWVWDGTSGYNRIDVDDLPVYLDDYDGNSVVWDMSYVWGGEKIIVTRMTQKIMPFSKLICSDLWNSKTSSAGEPADPAQTEVLETKALKEMKYEIEAEVLGFEDGKLKLQEVVKTFPKQGEDIPWGFTVEEWDMIAMPLAETCEIWCGDESFYHYEKINPKEFSALIQYWEKKYDAAFRERLWSVLIENGEIVKMVEMYLP